MLVIDVLGLKYIMTLITNKDARRNEQKETKNGFVERKEKEKKTKNVTRRQHGPRRIRPRRDSDLRHLMDVGRR